MTSSFLLELDTHAALAVEASEGLPNQAILDLAAEEDAVEVKLWGSIDPLDPANANYSETMGGAEWFPFEPQLLVTYPPGEGPKTFFLQVRDDVWNESAIVKVQIGAPEEVVVPPAPSSPGWPFSGVKPPSHVSPDSSRTLTGTSTVRVVSTGEAVREAQTLHFRTRVPVRTGTSVVRLRQVRGQSGARVRTRGSVVGLPGATTSVVGVSSSAEIIRRRGHADDEAILALLL